MHLKIAGRAIGEDQPVFIIAEAGVNHNGSLETAKRLVDVAKAAGADCIKFQTFRAEDLATEYADQAAYQSENTGIKESQQAMLRRLELSYDDHRTLRDYCREKCIIFASTPHSSTKDVDLLDQLDVPFFKIGSGDLTNLPFIDYIARKDRPIIISTGMGNLQEIHEAYDTINSAMNDEVVFLKCTTSYPCPESMANVKGMLALKNELKTAVGYSDHTTGYAAAALATSLGASVIEKHITLSKSMEGPDHKASLEPNELKLYIAIIRLVREQKLPVEQVYPKIKQLLGISLESSLDAILGSGELMPFPEELKVADVARKSVVAARDLPAGTTLSIDDLAIKRPGTGIPPKYIFGKHNHILGRRLGKPIKKDQQLAIEHLE